MKFFKSYILSFLVLFVVMLVDAHLSNLLTNLFPNNTHLLSHLLLIFILYISINLSENTNFTMLLLIGLLYDAYYFHIIGISTLLLPLAGIVISKYNSVLINSCHFSIFLWGGYVRFGKCYPSSSNVFCRFCRLYNCSNNGLEFTILFVASTNFGEDIFMIRFYDELEIEM